MADYNNNVIERELGWDDAIERDTPDFILLPEGEYDFTVDHFDRERFSGSEKMPACNKAVLYLNIDTPDGVANVRESLFMHTKGEGKLCAFFTCIGQRQHGQRVNMNWSAVPGARGRAKIGVREYQGKSYNEVKKFLEPAAPTAASGGYQQPAPNYQQPAGGYAQPGAYQPSGQYQQQTMPGYAQPGYTPSAPQQTGTYTPGKF